LNWAILSDYRSEAGNLFQSRTSGDIKRPVAQNWKCVDSNPNPGSCTSQSRWL